MRNRLIFARQVNARQWGGSWEHSPFSVCLQKSICLSYFSCFSCSSCFSFSFFWICYWRSKARHPPQIVGLIASAFAAKYLPSWSHQLAVPRSTDICKTGYIIEAPFPRANLTNLGGRLHMENAFCGQEAVDLYAHSVTKVVGTSSRNKGWSAKTQFLAYVCRGFDRHPYDLIVNSRHDDKLGRIRFPREFKVHSSLRCIIHVQIQGMSMQPVLESTGIFFPAVNTH